MTTPRLSRQLTMAEVARMLRPNPDAATPVGRAELQRTRDRLRRLEIDTGKQIVFGGGYRHKRGTKGGGRAWTTIDRLRHAGLVDDHLALFEQVGERVAELEGALAKALDKVELVDQQQRLLAKVLIDLQRDMAKLKGNPVSSTGRQG